MISKATPINFYFVICACFALLGVTVKVKHHQWGSDINYLDVNRTLNPYTPFFNVLLLL